MRRQSLMGSSRFEFDAQELDRRNDKRTSALCAAYASVHEAIESAISKYADGDILSRDGLTEWLGQQLVKDFIARREGQEDA